MNRISSSPSSELFTNGHLAAARGRVSDRPSGQLRGRSVSIGPGNSLPVFPHDPPQAFRIQTDGHVVEGRTDNRVRADVSQPASPPTDILRRAGNLGVLKEVQDTAASLVSEWRRGGAAPERPQALKRSAVRYLALRLAESCLEHGADDESVARWLGVDLPRVDRRRLPGIQHELRELENSPDGTVALGTFHAGVEPDAHAFVATYLEQIQHVRSIGGRLLLLIKRHALAELANVVRQLLVVLRHDVEAATPSRDPRWLADVLHDIGHMHLTNTLIDQLQALQRFMEGRQNPLQRHPMDMRALLTELMGLIEQASAVPSQIERLVDATGLAETAERIQLLVGLNLILRNMPARLFAAEQHQVLLVGCVQHCLDQMIESEESAVDLIPPEALP
ncbi:TyeA family type III secretion system gatekeeper subunit [uncultured Hydrogenophaga sp.]|uniref:TyeA family type III secretion system gatekeeper subunit n=1 Tax=uncultured Hydrogenophaga sp. TaxID=199683 RepID=UPI00265F2C4D|nr:TyeA family type III secretion system gatekeeper subunit [uncultured Hydrogenophaga sp.]